MSTEYNLAAVRRLLLAAFSAEDLERFCRDRPPFRPVCDRIGPRFGLDDMADELLEYARTHRLLDELLAAVQEHNPRQYAAFAPQLTAVEGDEVGTSPAAAIRRRGWLLVALIVVDLALLFLSGWCLFGHDPALVAYVQTAFTVAGVLVAIAAALLAARRPAAWEDVLYALGAARRGRIVVVLVTAACLVGTVLFCMSRQPPAPAPTAYMALIVDNGPVPSEHDFDELRAAVQVEVARALPNAALVLRVFGLNCGSTRRLVDFETGNAGEVAAALGTVQVVPQSDLTEAVRLSLDHLLAQPGTQPRVLVLVTWGSEGCGGDLDAALSAYRQWLGSTVSVNVIALGEPPLAAARPGLNVIEVDTVQEARDALRALNRVLETGTWSPRVPPFGATPVETP